MSAPKPVLDGPRAGQMRQFCTKCGHIEYLAAPAQSQVQQPNPNAGPH